MSIFKARAAVVGVALLLAGGPAAASVSLDFLASFNPSNDVHVELRATNGYFRPARADLERAAAVVRAPDEMAVVFFVARESGASVQLILDRRSRGDSWFSIMARFGVPTDALYLQLPDQVGPPYGKAHGYHRKHRSETRARALADAEIVDLVGLQVAAGWYRVDPVSIVDQRSAGRSFAAIHGELFRSGLVGNGVARREVGGEVELQAPAEQMQRGKGRGKGGGH